MIKPRLAGLEAMHAQKPAARTQVGAGAKRSQRHCSRTAIFNPPCTEGEEVTRVPGGGETPGEFQFLKSVTKVRRELLME